MPTEPQPDLQLRIVVEDPVPGVLLRLQRGRDELVAPTTETRSQVVFDLSVRVGPPRAGGAPTLLGPFTQGPPAARFVYITVGKRAGQADSPWDRRAKVPVTGISAAQIRAALETPQSRLMVRIPGRDRKGEPTCATVRLAPDAWHLTAG